MGRNLLAVLMFFLSGLSCSVIWANEPSFDPNSPTLEEVKKWQEIAVKKWLRSEIRGVQRLGASICESQTGIARSRFLKEYSEEEANSKLYVHCLLISISKKAYARLDEDKKTTDYQWIEGEKIKGTNIFVTFEPTSKVRTIGH